MHNILTFKRNLTSIFRHILIVIAFMAFLHVVFYNFKYIFDQKLKMGYIFHNNSFLIFSAIMIFLTFTGFLFIGLINVNRSVSAKGYIIILLILSLVLRLSFVLLYNSTPISDFMLLYRGAQEIAKGNFDFIKKSQYFLAWVYQIGFVAYQALIIKIFGQGYLVLKILNSVFSTVICLLIYLTGRRVFNETAGQIAGLIYCLYPAGIYMCTVLTNQILSALLFYLAMYLATGKLKKLTFALIGLLIASGNIIRPEGPIVLTTMVVFLLFFKKDESFQNPKFEYSIKIFNRPSVKKGCIVAGILIVFVIIAKLFDVFIISTGISDYPLSNRNPLWKIVVGLNYEEKGLYNKSDDVYVARFPLGEERNREEMKIIKERIKDKKKLLTLLQTKMRILWSDFDHSLTNYVVPGTDLTPFKTNFLLYLEKFYYTVITLFILISLGILYFKKDMYGNHMLYLIFILGFMFIHLFIEIQLRYRYLVMPAFFILGGFGIYSVSHYMIRLLGQTEKGKVGIDM